MRRPKTVDDYLACLPQWQAEITKLRTILLGTGLAEELKWGAPCYTHNGRNVVGINAFQSYFGLWFFQGALLEDEAGVLVNAQEGVTKALRQWRMQSVADIRAREIRHYVREAIGLVDAGRRVAPAKKGPVEVPAELRAALRRSGRAARQFASLTPGRQREYAEYIAEAKRDATKTKRIGKILPMIESGVGLNDRYRR